MKDFAVSGVSAGEELVSLREELARVEKTLAQVTVEVSQGVHPLMRPSVEYALTTSGKRLRPLLTVLAYSAARAASPIPPAVYRLACAIEIVHTYSLVHDDLPCMDDDDLRRGRATLHRAHGVTAATLTGAVLIPVAFQEAVQAGAELGLAEAERARLVVELAAASGARGMVGGQLLDLEAEGRQLAPDALEDVHRRKTGALLVSALRVGAIAAGASEAVLRDLSRFGQSLGLAFQIIDDVLDVEGGSELLGKMAGRDIALGKSSYPALYGVEGAREKARQQIEEAKAAVRDLPVPELIELADYVLERGR